MTEPLVVTITITDWDQERVARALDLSTPEAIVKAQEDESLSAVVLARLLIAGRERGASPEDILPANKLLLQMGGARAWMEQRRSALEAYELEDGRIIDVRVDQGGTVDEPGPISGDDRRMIDRAERYLLGPVIGHMETRLAIIAAHGGDVAGTAALIKAKLDDVVKYLTSVEVAA